MFTGIGITKPFLRSVIDAIPGTISCDSMDRERRTELTEAKVITMIQGAKIP
jgi:hypothetical protein